MKAHGRGLGGVIHCFSYSVELAREYVKMGYFIGIGGVVTFNNAKRTRLLSQTFPWSILFWKQIVRIFLGSQSGKAKFIIEPALCSKGHQRNQGYF